MTDTSINTGLLSDISQANAQPQVEADDELGQDVFLKLMVTQLSNQNPLDPLDNTEFVAQLAQFSSVEGIDKLNTTMEAMSANFQSSQAIQASSLVGRSVIVETDSAYLANNGQISGSVQVPYQTDSMTMNIYNSSGALVRSAILGGAEQGDVNFTWDGTDDAGNAQSADNYRFEFIGAYGEDSLQLATQMNANVDSVTIGPAGTLTLNLAGIGPVPLSSVTDIL